MEAIHYKGWIIIEETDPWAIKYGSNYRFFPEGEEGNGEVIRNSVTIEEAKDEITLRILKTMYPDKWIVKHEYFQPTGWKYLTDAVDFVAKWGGELQFKFNSI